MGIDFGVAKATLNLKGKLASFEHSINFSRVQAVSIRRSSYS